MHLKKLAFLACALGLLVLPPGPARSAEPLQLKIGWVVAGADSPFLLYGKSGLARHEGKSYTLDAIHFNGTPPMIAALASGEIDLVPFAYSSFALAVENAGMSDLRIIADIFQDGVPGYYTNEYMVLKNSPIRTIADLKGKVAAVNVAGSALDMALRAMLIKHHLNPAKDLTIVEVPFPNEKAELLEKKIDLMSGVRPFTADPALRAAARTLFTQEQAIGRSEMIILVAREGFLKQHRAAVIDYLEDELRAQHWYLDPKNHTEAVDLVAKFTKRPAAVYASWLFTRGDFYHDPRGLPDLKALAANIALAHRLGIVKASLDVRKYAELSLVKTAAARLK